MLASDLNVSLIGYLCLSGATLSAAVITGWFAYSTAKRTKTNHGMTIGQHVEAAANDAKLANTTAALVSLQLAEYKRDQAEEHRVEQAQLQHYITEDQQAHAELRGMLLQVAQGQIPPTATS